jgi:hypothetical protein
MTTKAQCPFCAKPISVWSVMQAGMPSWIRCSHCRERIRLTNAMSFLRIYFPAILLTGLLVVLFYDLRITNRWLPAVLAAVLWVAIEFGVSVAICRHGKFEKPPEKQKET